MERETLEAFVARNRITMTSESVYENPNMEGMPQGSLHYKCKLTARVDGQRRQMTVFFSMGLAHCREPEASEVLDCLTSDSASVENCSGFEDWASDLGYDPDSRKAEKVYRACERQAAKLRNLLGNSEYGALLYDVERM
jgi:hypothetical protein